MKHLVELQSLETDEINSILEKAEEMTRHTTGMPLHGKLLASLFYEPSTRTRLSFEAAIIKLGGQVLWTENAGEFSSAAKWETLEDTIRVIGGYVDAIVLRHNETGAAERAARVSNIPIINAGDGAGQHPSQALLDLYTIQRELGKIEGITITMVWDLKYGRTVRSLCYLLGKYSDIKIVFISPEHLKMEQDIKDYLLKHKIKFEEQTDMNAHLPKSDIVYMTRIQKERMSASEAQTADVYSINEWNLDLLAPHARLMHPLPHLSEINLPINVEQNDPRVAYFRQAQNGLYIRMALLSILIK
jgi:aspartate carbamoyltransferase catalytic subunit